VGFKSEKLKPLTGKTLAEVREKCAEKIQSTRPDFDRGRRIAHKHVYYLMSEENVKKELRKPVDSFGSDEASQAPESPFKNRIAHPRLRNFARVLGKYVRHEKVLSCPTRFNRLSGLPATNLGLDHRGFSRKECCRRGGGSIRRRSQIMPPLKNPSIRDRCKNMCS